MEAAHVASMKAATAKAAYMSVAAVVATKAGPIAGKARTVSRKARATIVG